MEIQKCFIPHLGEHWQRKDSVFQSSVQQKNIQSDRWGHFHWSIAVTTLQKKLKGERKMLVFNEAHFAKPARVNPTSQTLGFSCNREILWGWVVSLQPYLPGFSRTVPEHVGDGSHPAAADRESTMPNDSRAKQLHPCPESIPRLCPGKNIQNSGTGDRNNGPNSALGQQCGSECWVWTEILAPK